MSTPIDMAIGAIFKTNNYGNAIIVEYKSHDNVTVLFEDYGQTRSVETGNIRAGKITPPVRIPKDLEKGSVFTSNNGHEYFVVEYISSKDVNVEFVSDGYLTSTNSSSVRNGSVKNPNLPTVYGVGSFGIGPYSRKENTSAYDVWKDMIRRCYNTESLKRRPTYIECTVCDEWKNFQVFAEWYLLNLPKEPMKYHLDKDIKIPGNKIYSPDTCLIVTAEENCRLSGRCKKPIRP